MRTRYSRATDVGILAVQGELRDTIQPDFPRPNLLTIRVQTCRRLRLKPTVPSILSVTPSYQPVLAGQPPDPAEAAYHVPPGPGGLPPSFGIVRLPFDTIHLLQPDI